MIYQLKPLLKLQELRFLCSLSILNNSDSVESLENIGDYEQFIFFIDK
jgi:hypothetical protein